MIRELKAAWDRILEADDLDQMVAGIMPQPQSLAYVGAWVNFELTKNLSELNQLLVRYANVSQL